MAKVLELTRRPAPAPDETVLTLARELLRRVEAGEITSFAAAIEGPSVPMGGHVVAVTAGWSPANLMLGMKLVEREFVDTVVAAHEVIEGP